MKKIHLFSILTLLMFCFVSCGGDDPGDNGSSGNGDNGQGVNQSCESNSECPVGYVCDMEKKSCISESGNGGNGDNSDVSNTDNPGDNSDSGDYTPGKQDGDDDPITGTCDPGKKQTCPYQGSPETENVGPCRAGIRICNEDGTWGKCEGGYMPVDEIGELCSDGIDNDCDGEVDNGTDFDGDGHGACSDCCESTETCPSPKDAWDPENHACTFGGGEIAENCDSEISASSTDPMDYAKAIGLCKTTTEDSDAWGVISATISTPNDLTNKNVHAGSNGLLSKLGNKIKPQQGSLMLGLSSGKVTDPFERSQAGSTSGAPKDWFEDAHNSKFPAAGSCPSSGTSGSVNDAVMLTLKIRTPPTAKSFSFNIYFLTDEYPQYICSSYNDFFIALLDSKHESDDPTLQNPKDKNLAMDEKGNPVGVNLAPGGLFTQCENKKTSTYEVTSCIGTEDLEGTGFIESSFLSGTTTHGGTGWLKTRGNVVGGEVITLRLAIWDLADHKLDSLILIDNFKWESEEYTPGTGNY